MYKIEENKVLYDGNLVYEAPWEIENSEEYDNDLIIHYLIPPEQHAKFPAMEKYENVLCINFNGQVKWRLPFPKDETIGPSYQPKYFDMGRGRDGSFWTTTGSYSHRFDPVTGTILETIFTH